MLHTYCRKLLFLGLLALIALCSSCGSKKAIGKQEKQKELKRKGLVFEHQELSKKKAEEAANKAIPKDLPTYGYAIRNKALYDFIKDWEGTPHRMGGNTQKGVDCSGLVCQLYTEVYQNPFHARRAQDMFKETEPLSIEELQEGDLVFFKINGRRIDHIGVYLHNHKFVHTSASKGVMVSSLEQAYFKQRFYKGGRKKS